MTDLFGNSDSDEESFVATKRRRTLEEPTPTHQSTVGGSAVLEQSTVSGLTTGQSVRTEQQTADIQQVCNRSGHFKNSILYRNMYNINTCTMISF